MTMDECQTRLNELRRRQGTPRPMVRVDYAGTVYTGRLSRTDSDLESRPPAGSPFGLLVLEPPGLARCPETVLQIGSIPVGGIREAAAGR